MTAIIIDWNQKKHKHFIDGKKYIYHEQITFVFIILDHFSSQAKEVYLEKNLSSN